jgi:hypothetical protein
MSCSLADIYYDSEEPAASLFRVLQQISTRLHGVTSQEMVILNVWVASNTKFCKHLSISLEAERGTKDGNLIGLLFSPY